MRSFIKFILGFIKVLAVLGAVSALVGLAVTLSRDSEQKRYITDVDIDDSEE